MFISQPLRHYHYVQINILNNSSRLAVNFKMYQRFHKIQIIQLAEVAGRACELQYAFLYRDATDRLGISLRTASRAWHRSV